MAYVGLATRIHLGCVVVGEPLSPGERRRVRLQSLSLKQLTAPSVVCVAQDTIDRQCAVRVRFEVLYDTDALEQPHVTIQNVTSRRVSLSKEDLVNLIVFAIPVPRISIEGLRLVHGVRPARGHRLLRAHGEPLVDVERLCDDRWMLCTVVTSIRWETYKCDKHSDRRGSLRAALHIPIEHPGLYGFTHVVQDDLQRLDDVEIVGAETPDRTKKPGTLTLHVACWSQKAPTTLSLRLRLEKRQSPVSLVRYSGRSLRFHSANGLNIVLPHDTVLPPGKHVLLTVEATYESPDHIALFFPLPYKDVDVDVGCWGPGVMLTVKIRNPSIARVDLRRGMLLGSAHFFHRDLFKSADRPPEPAESPVRCSPATMTVSYTMKPRLDEVVRMQRSARYGLDAPPPDTDDDSDSSGDSSDGDSGEEDDSDGENAASGPKKHRPSADAPLELRSCPARILPELVLYDLGIAMPCCALSLMRYTTGSPEDGGVRRTEFDVDGAMYHTGLICGGAPRRSATRRSTARPDTGR
uniref:GP82 n=1 Tax=Caviid herpesvirus 2 str. CIDMTR TaxID=1415526 RepID=U6HC42_9BETA|nr:GP82 [Caviid herpesvirus 2 str. CIDMTR]